MTGLLHKVLEGHFVQQFFCAKRLNATNLLTNRAKNFRMTVNY